MDINNIHGPAAYTADNRTAAPPQDNTQLETQNREAAQAEVNRETARAVQDAFEVEITQAARAQQAAAAQETTTEPPAPPETPQETAQPPAPDQEARNIINIVA